VVKKHHSIYIHVPLCTRKCDYCHFFVLPHKQDLVNQYITALKQEFDLREQIQDPLTIYFGGGTPSLLPPETIARILSWISHSKEIEITLEVNPENATLSLMREFAKAGITRVSLGVQSLDDNLLVELSRRHDALSALAAIDATYNAGIENISIDLMYDLPSQTPLSWTRTLDRIENLPIKHLSLYNLTIEPHTPYYKRRKELESKTPPPEESLAMLSEAILRLESDGLKRYEISAFAKRGYESCHNSGYWTGRSFTGYGPSAFSYLEGRRSRNVANLSKYSKLLNEGILPTDFEEELSPSGKVKELLAVRLRLTAGAPLSEFTLPLETEEAIARLIASGLLICEGDFLKLTEKGTLFYDTVAEEIIEV
jgi:oxygen-independent coproporphyrinogen-3 oxidase